MTMNLKKDFTLTFFDHRLFPMPAFGGLFSFKISPLGEISYDIKKARKTLQNKGKILIGVS